MAERERPFQFGADDPELAAQLRKIYAVANERALVGTPVITTPGEPEEGHAVRGFLAILALIVIAVAALALLAFAVGLIAHAAVAGWNAA